MNPHVVEDVRAELLLAVARARREGRRILGPVTEARVDGRAPCLSGGGDIAPSVDYGTMKVPTGGNEIVVNRACARARQTSGTLRRAVDVDEEAHAVRAEGRDRTRPTRRALGFGREGE